MSRIDTFLYPGPMTQAGIEQAVESIWTLFRETDRRLDQRIAETDRRFEATEREIQALSAQTRAAENLFIGKWGRLLEALVRPGVAELFRVRGIDVNRTLERIRARQGGEEMEIDLLLVNGDALVVVEVKSTLKVEDVRKLLKDLETFLKFFPEYRGYRRFGAVAALAIDESADRYAYRHGLFVLTMGREGLVTLRNDDAFQPQDFAIGP
ncbi:DUF3782 domain-containing protein [Candidatus Thiosymbion oneisti]|uniref:DUF3782 domain-containing protein n=2 Tax=Candidatus Thiosymbion oneisti TaxID=589554 RepID=UPI00105B2D0C|nr:DUF3782 domain-containing protein [Candidatus Thiosymbion oneisti]